MKHAIFLSSQRDENFDTKIYEMSSIKSYSLRTFLKRQECTPISLKVLTFNSQWKNCSIFNNFYLWNWNIAKPHWYTPIHEKLFKNTKNTTRGIKVWEIFWDKQKKQNTFFDSSDNDSLELVYVGQL
jgi:hypothetical protein